MKKIYKRKRIIYTIKHKQKNKKKKNVKNISYNKIKGRETKKMRKEKRNQREKGITLIALIITILFSYNEKIKCSNSKDFLLTTIL